MSEAAWDNTAFAATEVVVRARLRALECAHKGSSLTAHAYATPDGKHHFYVPKATLGGVGYTGAQLAEIEAILQCFGLELLPLDYNAV